MLKEIHEVEIIKGLEVWSMGDLLGEYSTRDRALAVLDRIEELIENQCGLTFYMPADEDVIV